MLGIVAAGDDAAGFVIRRFAREERIMNCRVVFLLLTFSVACDSPTSPTGATQDLTETPPIPQEVRLGPPATTGRIAFVSDRDGETAIYLANPDGSGVKRLTPGEQPDWAPGGRQLAFRRSDGGLYTIDVDTARTMRVTAGSSPAWSPDGNRIAYQTKAGIHTIGVNGSDERLIVDGTAWHATGFDGAISPSWSPDGLALAFILTSYDWGHELAVVDLDDTTKVRRLATSVSVESTSWSPDGSMIAFTGLSTSIHAVPVTGGYPALMARGYTAKWTPTGGLIFDAIPTGGPCCRNMRIFTSGLDEAIIPAAVSPVRADYSDQQPAWSR
jgi:TolB protein